MKKIYLGKEESVEVELEPIIKNLNSLCKYLRFFLFDDSIKIEDSTIINPNSQTHPNTHEKLISSGLTRKATLFSLIITNKPYDNNFFFYEVQNLILLSLFGWEYLTSLPKSNGIVFFIADNLALRIDNTHRHSINDDRKAECIFDYRIHKADVDLAMCASLICPTCQKRLKKQNLSDQNSRILEDIKLILNDLGIASKWDLDIVQFWLNKADKQKQTSLKKNIFISYSHKDIEWLERIRVHLKPYERRSFIDVWDDNRIRAGQEWRKEIEKALQSANIAILLVSADFLASDFITQHEIPPLLQKAKDDGTRIISIILKPCCYDDIEEISRFQAVNPSSKTIIDMDEGDRERFFVKLAKDILDS